MARIVATASKQPGNFSTVSSYFPNSLKDSLIIIIWEANCEGSGYNVGEAKACKALFAASHINPCMTTEHSLRSNVLDFFPGGKLEGLEKHPVHRREQMPNSTHI